MRIQRQKTKLILKYNDKDKFDFDKIKKYTCKDKETSTKTKPNLILKYNYIDKFDYNKIQNDKCKDKETKTYRP